MVSELLDSTLDTIPDLVRAAQLGDRAAQSALYERYHGSALALAYRKLGNWDEAEELVQDVFIHAFDRLEQLRVPEAFGGWLRQIVRRMAINLLTRRRLAVSVDQATLESVAMPHTSPLDDLLECESRAQVRHGLDQLGEVDRLTLEAFYLGGHSLLEMAAHFEAPLGTIKRRLHVARKRLAEEMADTHAL
jgi:RNA polymerase sigma-70 factor (ECF subfamily)